MDKLRKQSLELDKKKSIFYDNLEADLRESKFVNLSELFEANKSNIIALADIYRAEQGEQNPLIEIYTGINRIEKKFDTFNDILLTLQKVETRNMQTLLEIKKNRITLDKE